jgi:hypothetical protein
MQRESSRARRWCIRLWHLCQTRLPGPRARPTLPSDSAWRQQPSGAFRLAPWRALCQAR